MDFFMKILIVRMEWDRLPQKKKKKKKKIFYLLVLFITSIFFFKDNHPFNGWTSLISLIINDIFY